MSDGCFILTKLIVTKLVVIELVVTELVVTELIVTELIVTELVVTELIVTELVVTELRRRNRPLMPMLFLEFEFTFKRDCLPYATFSELLVSGQGILFTSSTTTLNDDNIRH